MSATAVSRILTEEPITLLEARSEIASVTGRRVDKCTLYRWCLRGVGGIKLEHIRLGDRILTSRPAITRFITARSE
jgi:hypothetical protein